MIEIEGSPGQHITSFANQLVHEAAIHGEVRGVFNQTDVAVLDWLCAIQDSTDHVSVAVDKAAIIGAFESAGFKPNVNCGPAFREDDRDNVFRYLVGQALDGLQSVAIHEIIHKFSDDWKAKFVR